jgi:NADH-quinone oxidoreductase subunit F
VTKAQEEALDLDSLTPIIERYAEEGRSNLLPALLETQRTFGYLQEEVVRALGEGLRVPLSEIYGVIEFYTMLYSRPTGRTIVRVCTSPACIIAGGRAALRSACDHLGVDLDEPTEDGEYMVEEAACLGLCDHAPAALVGETPVARVSPDSPWLWIATPRDAPIGMVGGYVRWLTGRIGHIEPTDIDAYRERGGFEGLRKVLETMSRSQVIELMKGSGLSGRGGAAFPTGLKWQYTASANEAPRYVVCNADESEPGTFKDRSLMEGDPYAVLEGMIIAGYAIDSQKGFLYIRGEYPRARRILHKAIEQARQAGLLGEDILESGFDFDIEIRSGAGAYICGEETALFESIEGKRGFPRLKPPFPTTNGLFSKPTLINNVETLCAAAWILAHGAEKYRSIGTEDSPGSKLFCLSGDVRVPGVYEAAFGTPLYQILELAGGAVGEIQAVLLGGAAGAFATPDQLDLPMSFEGTEEAGLPLGSGVVMVINKQRDLREVLLSLAHFFAHESCGKCFPCQLGTQRQMEIVAKVSQGKAEKADLEALKDVGHAMTNASLCGLGMTAGTAVLSALELWPELFSDGR